MRAVMQLGAVVALVAAACGGDEPAAQLDAASPPVDAQAPDAAGPDPSDALFRPDHVLEVQLTLAPADWAALRAEPDEVGLPRTTCAGPVAVEPYTTFMADLTIDGVTVADVGVRKKGGFGSLSSARPGLKIKANKFMPGQRVFGLEKLTLNNNHQDPTYVSQCLGYGLFTAAGLPASRCSFAHVVVNGEDLGIYSNVESIDEDFLARRFADPSGHLYESGGDFVPGGTLGFQPKVDEDAPDCSDLAPVVDALASPAAALPAALGAVVDLDQFTRYWAMEVLTDHWDGYANNQNNFWFYGDPSTGKFVFLPSGIDALFTEQPRTTRPDAVFACGALPWHLYDVPATRAAYLAALRDLIATVWDEAALTAEVDRLQALLTPFVDPDGTGAFAAALDATRAFIATRAGVLLAELDAGDPVWPYAAGEASCRINIGTMTTSFSTTWDTLGTFGIGSGTMGGTVGGTDLTSSTVYANAGRGDDGKPMIQVFAALGDGRYAVGYIVQENGDALAPGTLPVDLVTVAAVLTFYDPATDTGGGGGIMLTGTLTLDAASEVPGATVSGTLTGDIFEL